MEHELARGMCGLEVGKEGRCVLEADHCLAFVAGGSVGALDRKQNRVGDIEAVARGPRQFPGHATRRSVDLVLAVRRPVEGDEPGLAIASDDDAQTVFFSMRQLERPCAVYALYHLSSEKSRLGK